MSIAQYQNFGGVLFQDAQPPVQANSVSFPNAFGQIRHIPVYNYSYETNSGDIIENLKGWRVETDITITMVSEGDPTKWYNLITMLRAKMPLNGRVLPIYIYPRYESAMVINDWYAMLLTTNIEAIDVSKQVKIGQTFNLGFRSKGLVQLSQNISLFENPGTVTILGTQTDLTITIAGSQTAATIIGSKE